MSKILQLVLPFWVMARKYAKSYTDSRMTGLVGLAYGLALENGVMKMTVYDSRAITASLANGVMKMTVYDSRAITASLANGTFILNNQQ